jgi:para-aminobenzoate synthetase component 1
MLFLFKSISLDALLFYVNNSLALPIENLLLMKRTSISFTLVDVTNFKELLLSWSQQYSKIFWLDSNNYQTNYPTYDACLAIEENQVIKLSKTDNAFQQLSNFRKLVDDYIFGFLSYDLKNDIEQLSSTNKDELQFPSLFFFQPKKIIFIKENIAIFSYLSAYASEITIDYNNILSFTNHLQAFEQNSQINLKQQISKNSYLKKCKELLKHIHRGDIYEINFCMEFYIQNHTFNPSTAFQKLNKISAPPFAAYFKIDELYLCCASPERYLKKESNLAISQPIKGTAKRDENPTIDAQIKEALRNNPKEQSENIMIVDLVRNDLSKTAIKGSVKVEELCELYSFKQVHQLISTVVAQVDKDIDPIILIKNTFPMGSMTGAPKISAMKIIEEIEETKRGLYSGAVGYFAPNGDFDFNVVIRSILHNATNKYTSFSVGSAITSLSNPEKEYEECMLKGKAMMEVLSGK